MHKIKYIPAYKDDLSKASRECVEAYLDNLLKDWTHIAVVWYRVTKKGNVKWTTPRTQDTVKFKGLRQVSCVGRSEFYGKFKLMDALP